MVFTENYTTSCTCGNEISYIDTVFEGGRDRENYDIICSKCNNEITVRCDNLGGLEGASLKIEKTESCPYCNLTLDTIEKMNENEADRFVLDMKGDDCCMNHLVKQVNIRKAKSLMGKDLLKVMISDNE